MSTPLDASKRGHLYGYLKQYNGYALSGLSRGSQVDAGLYSVD